MITVFSTPLAFMRSSSISGVASVSGGFTVSFAHGYFGSFFQTCTCGSMMRYLRAPRAGLLDCEGEGRAAKAPMAARRLTLDFILKSISIVLNEMILYRFAHSGRWSLMPLDQHSPPVLC